MNSKEINKLIEEIEKIEPPIYESCLGEKLIPHIGWYWRQVNFDMDYHYLGIIPPMFEDDPDYFEHNPTHLVGFMENNKWGYDIFKVDKEEWLYLKALIIKAVTEKTAESFKEVDDYMQSLLPKRYKDQEKVIRP